ncbi:TetR family transcriptional regulator C-terminal domain-containing protein [Nocardiopsis sp. RSe5-2]|uniref:TetR family transcriptional regulator C-terminal domain-containing protein n=1 Tax=Nocardiopsis endophytica TaxID=3018445 RepID=A0ABT4UD12_9ACTN|nr:TetR family transcriptional regulator [Nocardiopsis endophytica]MDA2814777.1 TetR family transcriptional regulator C-terminal domain-containing protein [Nocardiopsis endophytica]
MPKKVDHHARRTRIADALIRVAARHGLEAVSLRHVASEAGVSTGMVQHYFRDKNAMMAFALRAVAERVQDRLERARPDALPPKESVRGFLMQLLPLDTERAEEGKAALAFQAHAAVHPDVAGAVLPDPAPLRAHIADLIRSARAARTGRTGRTGTEADAGHAGGPDPYSAAVVLLALAEGLGTQILTRECTPEDAVAALDAQLDTAFG